MAKKQKPTPEHLAAIFAHQREHGGEATRQKFGIAQAAPGGVPSLEEVVAAGYAPEAAPAIVERVAREQQPQQRGEGAPDAGRDVAFCYRTCQVYLDGGLHRVLGGEVLEHHRHVDQVRNDTAHFRLIRLQAPDHLERIRKEWRDEFDEMKKRAAELGLVVYRDGEVAPPKHAR